MPGGEAMVQLGPTASMDEWAEQLAAHELRHETGPYACPKPSHRGCKIAPHVADEDDTWPAFQTLRFWSEQWREQEGYPLEGRRPTIATESGLIRHMLHWAWEHEPNFATMASDVADARRRLEDVLSDGVRSQRGVPCMYDKCRGARLVRKLEPYRDEAGEKRWRHSLWHCPRCHRKWDEDAYARMVVLADEAAKVEDVAGETWCSVDYAARRVGRPEATIRSWIHRGHVAIACLVVGRRRGFVRLADVEARQLEAEERRRGKRPQTTAA
jgi:hypothetical protein